MARIRTLAAETEAYAREHKQFPAKLMRAEVDGWGNRLRYECWKGESTAAGCDHYAIASAGADGKFTAPVRDVMDKASEDADEDIVFRDGEFVRYPMPPRGMRN